MISWIPRLGAEYVLDCAVSGASGLKATLNRAHQQWLGWVCGCPDARGMLGVSSFFSAGGL